MTWVAHMRAPIDGRFMAFYVNMQYNVTNDVNMQHNVTNDVRDDRGWPLGQEGMMEFTTTVSVVPDVFPYEECHGDMCLGTLV